MYSSTSALTRGLFWCLFPELRSNEGNKYQNNTRVSAETVRHESTYIILFLTRHNESINHYKWRDLHIAPVSHSFGCPSADDATVDCWWRHNDQTIVTRSLEQWYLTRKISILFTAIFTADRVRKWCTSSCSQPQWCNTGAPWPQCCS